MIKMLVNRLTETGFRDALETPVVKILLSQGAATAIFLALRPLANSYALALPGPIWLLALGAVAAIIGWFFGLRKWWAAVQLVFPVAIAWALSLALPSYVWLAFFVLTLLVYWNSFRGGVPLYLTNRTTWSALEKLLPEKSEFMFVDLGGGIAGTALYLAARHPNGIFVSVESAPIPYAVSWLRKVFSGRPNVKVVYGDMWRLSLEPFDVAYAFLSPRPMADLYAKAADEMRRGAVFISNSFEAPGHDADVTIELDDNRRTRLHVWRFHAKDR